MRHISNCPMARVWLEFRTTARKLFECIIDSLLIRILTFQPAPIKYQGFLSEKNLHQIDEYKELVGLSCEIISISFVANTNH